MNKTSHYPPSASLLDYEHELCPVDAHIHITPRGTWINDDCTVVVRAFSLHDVTHWVREDWVHANGHHATMAIITKAEFLSLIRA